MMGVSPEQAARARRRRGRGRRGGELRDAHDRGRISRASTAAFRRTTDLPIMIQSNAGSPELVDGRAVYRLSPEAFADGMAGVVDGRRATLWAAAAARRPRTSPRSQPEYRPLH